MVYDDKAEFVGRADERRRADGEEPLFWDIVEAIIERNRNRAEEFTEQSIEEEASPLDVVEGGHTTGTKSEGGGLGRREQFLPELAPSANCTRAGVQHVDSLLAEIDQNHSKRSGQRDENRNRRNERPTQNSHHESLDTRRIGRNRTPVYSGGTV